MNNEMQHNMISGFFSGYTQHLNQLLAGSAAVTELEVPPVSTEFMMEPIPDGGLYKDTKEDGGKHHMHSVQLVSSDIHMLDSQFAISRVLWKYNDATDANNEEVEFYVFYLLKIGQPDIKIVASITGDEEGLLENGVRSLMKLYLYEKRKDPAYPAEREYVFSSN